ncbi:MAG: glycerol acyltransferase [Bacteroidales bacterium 45-6]|nr:MAG: glycerol acyltransferase [Bacteroidales bacterium 45-6]
MATDKPFQIDLDQIIQSKIPRIYPKIPQFLFRYLKRKIHQAELNEILRLNHGKYGVDFMRGAVDYFGLKFEISGLDALPLDKPMVFVSNHPLGGLDGICLSAIIGEKYNHNIKYLVNDLLYYIENLKPIFIPINKYGMQNRTTSQMINEAFASGDQVITFPAGLCSRKIEGEIVDLPWGKMFIQKAVEFKRDVVPVYFDAQNSNFFYRLASIRKKMGIKFNFEMLYLPDEMFRNKGKTFRIRFGRPIPWETFDKSRSAKEWTGYVRNLSYQLKNNLERES